VGWLRGEELLHPVRIKALVVWDSVSTLGLPTQLPPRPLSFVGKEVPQAFDNAFQALALDESRAKFKPLIWKSQEDASTYVKQCWFLGSHSDVGGNGDAPLGAVTLIWMIGQLQTKTGALFNRVEIAKHLKHKFLEWDFRVNKALGKFKETSILSTMSSYGECLEVLEVPSSSCIFRQDSEFSWPMILTANRTGY